MPLAELEFDHKMLNNRNGADDKLYVRFFTEVLPDEAASKAAGLRKFRDVEMITIMVPGNKKEVRTREARPEDIERFQGVYDKFKKDKDAMPDGTPISEWNQVSSPALKEELRYMGFITVEQLAGASESVLVQNAGLRTLKQRAAQWLLMQQENAPVERLSSELADRDAKIEALQQQMAEMTKAMLEFKQKRAA